MSGISRWLLRRCLGETDADVLLDELEEMYLYRVEAEGRPAAKRWRNAEERRAAWNALASRIRRDPRPQRPGERRVRRVASLGEGRLAWG